ncbi:LexA family protein [Corynebacterium sp. TAE3-ERU16]|uniref:LexA family protein n=1 Tax=Corynebacterium sp. TAE3-ERU16 TaxID=2849493 RepID=UPI001C4574E7|nr:helix-turn-helix domain-containing protein [Corynebacterium sp. TAE3-ERU16]MBV7292333.1 helix-turn-helix domain-containing protein [Corynebacterium sp. TAE3-ERU16]
MTTILQGPRPEDDFTMIPNALIRSSELTPRDKAVYMLMRSHREGWALTTASIGEALGITRKTVGVAIRALMAAGYVIREEGRMPDGRFGVISYTVLSTPVEPEQAAVEASQAPVAPDRRAKSTPRENPSSPGEDFTHGQDPTEGKNYPPPRAKITHHKKTISKKIKTPQPPTGACPPGEGAAASRRRGSFLPDSWMPSPDSVRALADAHPEVDLDRETERFVDHYRSLTGRAARRRDWDAAWRGLGAGCGFTAPAGEPAVESGRRQGRRGLVYR